MAQYIVMISLFCSLQGPKDTFFWRKENINPSFSYSDLKLWNSADLQQCHHTGQLPSTYGCFENQHNYDKQALSLPWSLETTLNHVATKPVCKLWVQNDLILLILWKIQKVGNEDMCDHEPADPMLSAAWLCSTGLGKAILGGQMALSDVPRKVTLWLRNWTLLF